LARSSGQTPNKSLDASGGSAFRNLLGAAEGAFIRAAASTQPLSVVAFENQETSARLDYDGGRAARSTSLSWPS